MSEYISKITLPNGITYDVKDLGARQLIQDIASAGISFVISTSAGDTPKGVEWNDGQTVIIGTLEPAASVTAIYLVPIAKTGTKDIYAEYVCVRSNAVYIWEKLGTTDISLDSLGDLAKKDSVTGSVTVIDTVTAKLTNASTSVSGSITPAGTVKSTFTGSALTSTGSLTPSGSVTSTLATDAAAAVDISYTPAGKVTGKFTGAEVTSTGSFTPTGTVSKPAVSVSLTKETAGASKIKLSGKVTAGVPAEFTEGAFTPGSFKQGTDTFVAPSLTTSVENETLVISFNAGSFTQGSDAYTSASKAKDTWHAGSVTAVTLPTFEDVDLVSGVSAELATAPAFTGSAGSVSVSGTTAGSLADLAFTGTAASLQTSAAVTGTINSSFTGTKQNISVSGTPEGTVASTFTGTEATVSSNGNVTGDVTVTTTTATKTIISK